jgi:maltose alpha-D-glucosyltransferase/alpha-amylase
MKRIKVILIALLLVALVIAATFFFRKDKDEKAIVNKAIPADSTAILWYKSAVIYTLDVEVFNDSDGDGIGDFRGLTEKLGYIDSLGVNVIWLAPFQPTPNKDDGYDVSDFYGIDKRLGTAGDFKSFMDEAKRHGLRVIMDLVLNHTSIEHPWYREARKNAKSPYRSWYVWAKERPDNYDVGMVFPGVQKEIWTYDTAAKEYYYHRFYDFQPDLNAQNKAVQAEVRKIVKYWIDLGVAGFRLDAVPFYIEVPQTKGEKFEHQFEMLTQLRSYLQGLKKDAIFLGEANVLPEETEPYFGEKGDAMQMMFNFFVNQHLFYALATGEVEPLKKALEATEEIPKAAQWGQFLRNHDELDLGRLSRKERNEVFEKFGPDKNMQLYDRGIRRRLAPMMNNNKRQIELAYSVLFSLPSTPVMRYGDEIGMGDNLALKERETVRTPMQWNTDMNGGFSSAAMPVKPSIDTGKFGYKIINASLEDKQPQSMLNVTKHSIRLHKECPEISYGNREIVQTGNDHVLALRYEWQDKKVLVLHNFSDEQQEFTLTYEDAGGRALKGISFDGGSKADDKDKHHIKLAGYGYKWYRVDAE